MDYIIGIIAQNAVTASLESCVPHLLAAAADDMAKQTKACLHQAALESPRHFDNSSTSSGLVSDHSRRCIATLAEGLADSAVTKVCCLHIKARKRCSQKASLRVAPDSFSSDLFKMQTFHRSTHVHNISEAQTHVHHGWSLQQKHYSMVSTG